MKKFKDFLIKYPYAIAATIAVVIFAVFAAIFKQDMQIGGILDKLWGRKRKSDHDVRAVPPKDRIDDKGNPIEPGDSDKDGWVQAPEIPIKKPSIFDSPDTIKIIHPEKGEIEVKLPEGVKNKDVAKVVIIAPNIIEVRNKDKPKIDVDKLLEDLRRK
jgi:hypothetical protein